MAPSVVLCVMLSVSAISLLGLLGAITLSWNTSRFDRGLRLFIAVAIGVLLGEAVCHLIPDSVQGGTKPSVVVLVVALGFAASAGGEQFCRAVQRGSAIAPVGRISLAVESLHNAIDGVLVAAAYAGGIHVGILATVAVVIHEIPHELSNFAVLIHSGFGRKRALMLNFLSACASFIGAGAVVLGAPRVANISAIALPVAAGSLLYIAIAGLLPGLWRSGDPRQRLAGGFGIAAGILSMALVKAVG